MIFDVDIKKEIVFCQWKVEFNSSLVEFTIENELWHLLLMHAIVWHWLPLQLVDDFFEIFTAFAELKEPKVIPISTDAERISAAIAKFILRLTPVIMVYFI